MPLLHWGSEFQLGVPSIDDEHQKIFEDINVLYDLMQNNGDQPLPQGQMLDILHLMEHHFIHEEDLFAQTVYPDRFNHTKEHERFRKETEVLLDRAVEGGAEASRNVLNYLVTWLTKHLLDEDRKYASHLMSNGIG